MHALIACRSPQLHEMHMQQLGGTGSQLTCSAIRRAARASRNMLVLIPPTEQLLLSKMHFLLRSMMSNRSTVPSECSGADIGVVAGLAPSLMWP